ncbi:hypothetical protein CKAH01_01182 [Colletotrichum kahawae]|uniref:Uncharacterized protein n=1 Tax=Colletotrichum kahawae TaxID=34407 RepID=A0AAE0D537_COLKA|nr:hypothetical protein CKAH01_01182 [Colletotrichum kahawae]
MLNLSSPLFFPPFHQSQPIISTTTLLTSPRKSQHIEPNPLDTRHASQSSCPSPRPPSSSVSLPRVVSVTTSTARVATLTLLRRSLRAMSTRLLPRSSHTFLAAPQRPRRALAMLVPAPAPRSTLLLPRQTNSFPLRRAPPRPTPRMLRLRP